MCVFFFFFPIFLWDLFCVAMRVFLLGADGCTFGLMTMIEAGSATLVSAPATFGSFLFVFFFFLGEVQRGHVEIVEWCAVLCGLKGLGICVFFFFGVDDLTLFFCLFVCLRVRVLSGTN